MFSVQDRRISVIETVEVEEKRKRAIKNLIVTDQFPTEELKSWFGCGLMVQIQEMEIHHMACTNERPHSSSPSDRL